MDTRAQLSQLEAQLASLKARLPAHSVRPAMMIELEELEDEIDRLKAELRRGDNGDAQSPA
jgi:hypothetical protein